MTVEIKCPTHPTYQAIRKPTADCSACHKLFNLKRELEAPKNAGDGFAAAYERNAARRSQYAS